MGWPEIQQEEAGKGQRGGTPEGRRGEPGTINAKGGAANEEDRRGLGERPLRDWKGEIEICARAYVKMCLHAARYPHTAVNGLLLAQKRRATVAGQADCLCVTDCVPLFHSNLSLTVMLEVALNQIDLWSAESDLLLAGYYQANSGIDDKSPSPLAQKTAGRIAELYDDAVLIM
ncbi:PREDICTED: ER membrane protein complex subunit 9, partial [Gekko japonicus]|uniref:ER membrane protein complex subunit 9 n=1 Tax=Gekko japonicus TaxID=146911 RepID=A0ABM1KEL7_GEKJA